jgi:branched-chain amino acid transport system ATP-binding protein/urea transport system ATP-binding protein
LGIGYTPQGGLGFPALTVKENLMLATSIGDRRTLKSIDEILNLFPRLSQLLNRRSAALSGGERQLLALARAMIRSPKLLLLDELTEGVQPSVTDELTEHLLRTHQVEKVAMIIADQDLSFVASLVSRALVMQKGTFILERRPEELNQHDVFGDPRQEDDVRMIG